MDEGLAYKGAANGRVGKHEAPMPSAGGAVGRDGWGRVMGLPAMVRMSGLPVAALDIYPSPQEGSN